MSEDAGSRWNAFMRMGDFESAWQVSDGVMRASPAPDPLVTPRHQQRVWDGRPLDGKRVLIRCYHGLGDTIQFIRYAPLVKAVASSVVVWAQPALLPLLRSMDGIDQLEPLHDGEVEVPYDVDAEVMELPYIFRSTPATIPSAVPYLQAAPARIRNDGRLKVGLVCQVGDWEHDRSIPLGLLRPLAEVEGIDVQLLHALPGGIAVPGITVAEGTDTIMGTAGLMGALDLVISVDSMPAHLAGALGREVWTLLKRDADWRWMDGRDDSPWYPTMRLFRQERAGEWEPVIARMVDELVRRRRSMVEGSDPRQSARSDVHRTQQGVLLGHLDH